MKYIGEFKDINDKLYKVEITNDKEGTDVQLLFNGTPFITSTENNDILFKPCKYSSATVGLLAKDYLYGLYATKAQENKITLSTNNIIVWTGYVTPNLYSQSYEYDLEELELECIDALSTLQYYDYSTIGDSKQIVSLKDLICHCLKKCSAYEIFYFSGAYISNDKQDRYLLEHCYISEQNFFDEDDKPMTYQQVLEEVCKYFNVTAVAVGNNVYFINYEAIKSGINRYYAYHISTGVLYNDTNIASNLTITAQEYTENGGKLSLDEVYNKVTVADNLYGYDSILPDIFNEKDLIPQKTDSNLPIVGTDSADGKNFKFFFKYYKNNNCKQFYYNKATEKPESVPDKISYNTTVDYIGATLCKHKSVQNNNSVVSKVDLQNYILLHQHNVYMGASPLITFNPTIKPAFVPSNAKIIINGTLRIYDFENKMFILEGVGRDKDSYSFDTLKLKCRLKVGDYYWTGAEWADSIQSFDIQIRSNQSYDHYIGIDFPISIPIDYTLGIDATTGYVAPYPTELGNVLTAIPEFTICSTPNPNSNYRIDAVWLSNFDVKLLLPTFDDDTDTDTKYENVIDSDFVKELPEISLKVCSWDNKQLNYSCVAHKMSNEYKFLTLVFNESSRQTKIPEEHLINALVNQYSTPSIILDINLKNTVTPYTVLTTEVFQGKKFVVDTLTTDYRLASSNVKLIEKK